MTSPIKKATAALEALLVEGCICCTALESVCETCARQAQTAAATALGAIPAEELAQVLHDADCGCGDNVEHDDQYTRQATAVRNWLHGIPTSPTNTPTLPL